MSGYDAYGYSNNLHSDHYDADVVDPMMMYQNPYDHDDPNDDFNHPSHSNNLHHDHNDDDQGDEDDDNTMDHLHLHPNDDLIDYDHDPEISNLPRIIMMGPRRGGKTSIQRVVFHKMSPHETLFRLEATQSLERSVVDLNLNARFTIWDFPGDYYGPTNSTTSTNVNHNQMGSGIGGMAPPQQQFQHSRMMMRQLPVHANNADNIQNEYANHNQFQQPNFIDNNELLDPDHQTHQEETEIDESDLYIFGKATALIFVLDAQDEPYDHVLQHFTETVKRAARANPNIAIEVFINKVDGELFLSDEAKYDCRRDVMQQVTDELADAGVLMPSDSSLQISYHLTSIYDHSVFEAFSRVVQKLIPNLQPTLENLLNGLVSTCAMEKAYLFDVASKLYISTDSSPVDMQSVELCSDMIDCVLDVSGIYGLAGSSNDNVDDLDKHDVESSTVPPGSERMSTNPSDPAYAKNGEGKMNEGGLDGMNHAINEDDFGHDIGTLDYGHDGDDELVGTLIRQSAGGLVGQDGKRKEADADSAYDSESASVIRLSKGMVS